MRHRLAVASLFVLVTILLAGALAPYVAPYPFDGYDANNLEVGPTLHGGHVFGTDLLGRDYFSRVLYGIRTSERVAFLVAILAVTIGTLVGALAGYYSKWADNALMRFTDLILTLPALAVLLVAAALIGKGNQYRVAIILALLLWTALARIVRGQFLSLREKEYVDAAKAAGAGDLRIIFRHMLPNSLGPIVVFATLTVGRSDPARGIPLVPRLRRAAADAGAREAHRRRPGRLFPRLVAGHVPGAHDRPDRALHQLRRGRPARRTRPDSAYSCLNRSFRSRT